MNIKLLIFCLAACLGLQTTIKAQTSEITFNVNLKPQLVDSTFVPGRDEIKIVGDLYPINTPNPYFLLDEEPIDSVYSITVRFSSRFRNQMLTYNFEMMTNYIRNVEVLPRNIQLMGQTVQTDPLYFNAFAW